MVNYFNFNAFEQEERYENCMIGNSPLKVCMIQYTYVFSIKHVQLELVSYIGEFLSGRIVTKDRSWTSPTG